MKINIEKSISYACTALVVLEALMLCVWQTDLLFAAQDFTVWHSTAAHFGKCIAQPLGLLLWLSAFLTQFFYYPYLGIAIMLAMWLMSYFGIAYGFRVPVRLRPLIVVLVVCIQVSITQVGYWIYTLQLSGYWFFGTVLLLWVAAFSASVRKVGEIGNAFFRWMMIAVISVAWILMLTPFNGMPHFNLFEGGPSSMLMPLYLGILVVLILAFSRFAAKYDKIALGVSVAAVVAALNWGFLMNYHNPCFRAELRMATYVEKAEWQKIIDTELGIDRTTTRQMQLLRDAAIICQHAPSDSILLNPNDGYRPQMITNPPVHMAYTGGDVVYYAFGMSNYSYRWSFENAVEFGFSPRRLRMLLRCAMLNGEWDLCRRYIARLRTTMFHSAFADEMDALVGHPEAIAAHPEFRDVKRWQAQRDILTSDNGYPEKLIIRYLPATRKVQWNFRTSEVLHTY